MLSYWLGNWWEFGLTAAYSVGMPYTPYDLATRGQLDGVWYCDEGTKNSVRYPDYFRIDLRIELRFVFQSWNIRAFIDFWNVTNHRNIFEYSYKNGYETQTVEVLFPLMPIIGVAAEI